MTVNDNIDQIARCPLCHSNVNVISFAKVGLSIEELTNLDEYVKSGRMKDVINIAGIAMRWLGDPEKTNVELQIKGLEQFIRELVSRDLSKEISEAISTMVQSRNDNVRDHNELKQSINAISTKLIGTGIGNVSEKTVMKDLKCAMANTMDSFSDERASKQGTDIVGTVKERGRDCGKISISVKNTEKWGSSFMVQLKKNMRDDGSRLGIIATKVFPAEALSEQMYISQEVEEGKTVIVVKLEYISLAYFALRHVAIHLFETQQTLKMKEEETDDVLKAFKTLVAYINGNDFQQSISHIDNAIKGAQETIGLLSQLRSSHR
jgi:hypothetical protein